MTGYVTTWDGEQIRLPVPLSWEMSYTVGTPCDSFWLKIPWDADQKADPADWVGFSADHKGERMFTGVVDECELLWDAKGSRLELSGRGMAALLLDNEAGGQDYGTATLDDILRDHVYPFGIRVAERGYLPAVNQFSVSTGSSEWSVLYDFARFHGGITPRFNRRGELILKGWTDSETLTITDAVPVTSLTVRDRRYGVLSEVLVRDRRRQTLAQVKNQAFAARGGRCRRVVTLPRRGDFKTARYSGQFQLDRSAAAAKRLEVTVAVPFYGKPGDLVRLQRTGWGRNGNYRVIETRVTEDERGSRTVLVLAQPNVVL